MNYLRDSWMTGNHQCLDKSLQNGTNDTSGHTTAWKILVWSAANEKAINRMIGSYGEYYKNHIHGDNKKLGRLAYTLATRRSRMSWRSYSIISPHDYLNQFTSFHHSKTIRESSNVATCFVFTGQGAQYANMSLDLIHYPKFRETLQSIDDIFRNFGLCMMSDKLSRWTSRQ
jgi:acyl transferase domain-containing protein